MCGKPPVGCSPAVGVSRCFLRQTTEARQTGGESVAVRAGAEPFASEAGSVGVLLCHGFTGSRRRCAPGRRRSPAGFAVDLPLLPGHGTRSQDLQLTRWADWYATRSNGPWHPWLTGATRFWSWAFLWAEPSACDWLRNTQTL